MKGIIKYLASAAILLVSVGALAQESSVSGIKVNKTATYRNGMGEITLEAFATGQKVKTVTESHLPTDIVLVLDVSGSMSDKITFNGKKEITSGELATGTTYKVVIDGKEYYLKGFKSSGSTTVYTPHTGSWSYDAVNKGTYYYKDGDNYYEVYTDYDTSGYGKNAKKSNFRLYYSTYWSIFGSGDVYLWGTGTQKSEKGVKNSSDTIFTGTLYTKETKTGTIYKYRYSTSEPKSDTSGYEFYTGMSNFRIGDEAAVSNYKIYSGSSSTVSKLSALQTAVCDFINQIAADSQAYNVEHRISIVKFAGTTTDNIGNSTYSGGYNNSQIVSDFKSAKTYAESMKKTINNLNAGGGTRASDGMIHAKDLILGNSGRGLQGSAAYYQKQGITDYGRVVVMFTDGEPGDYGFNSSYRNKSDYTNGWFVANKAIGTSKVIKDAGVTVYSVGVIANPGDDVKHYLELLSSDYPDAEAGFNIKNGTISRITSYTKEDEGFYQMSSGANLSDIFQTIANETSTGGATKQELDAESVMKDIIDPDFNLPEGTKAEDIKIYVAQCTGCTASTEYPDDADMATYTFSNTICQVFGKGTGTIITPDPSSPGFKNIKAAIVNKDGKDDVSITGFSYKDYWCGNEKSSKTSTLHAGYKIIVKIPFVVTACHEDRSTYETNEPESGIYTKAGKKVIGFPIPNLYSIIIVKRGLKAGETAIFKVYGKGSDNKYSAEPMYTTMVIGDDNESTADYQIITAMEDGEYKVVEETSWSWTYENAAPSVEHRLSENNLVVFAFTNSKKVSEENPLPQNAEATVTNVMGTDGSQSASSK